MVEKHNDHTIESYLVTLVVLQYLPTAWTTSSVEAVSQNVSWFTKLRIDCTDKLVE